MQVTRVTTYCACLFSLFLLEKNITINIITSAEIIMIVITVAPSIGRISAANVPSANLKYTDEFPLSV
jgi:hypothetical protein